MIRNITVAIDVGSSTTRVVVGEFNKGEKNPKVIGMGESETKGMRHGYVVNQDDVARSIKNAIKFAENTSQIKIKKAFLSISGISLRGDMTSSSTIVSKADGEVTTLDINKAIEECEDSLNLNNKKIIQTFPVSFRLDGKEVLGRIEGMRGTKLEIKALILTYSMQHLEDLGNALALAGIEATEIVGAPIAEASVALTEKQKIVGVGLVNIGSETVTLTVFENGAPILIQTFQIGSSNVTNDVALGLKIPLDLAENLKRGGNNENYSKKKLDEIVDARMADIFESIDNSLKKIKRSELLPAGIVFTGGGANMSRLPELSKSVLNLPSFIGSTEIFGNIKTKLRDPSWFAVLGLLTADKSGTISDDSSIGNLFRDIKNGLKSISKQLLP